MTVPVEDVADAAGAAPARLPRLGPLEHRIMDVLWDCPDDLCARRVLERLASDHLAYTTVATVLTNLHRKGLLEKERTPRSWAYRPRLTRVEYVAGCMADVLSSAEDRAAALRELVRHLAPAERAALAEGLRGAETA